MNKGESPDQLLGRATAQIRELRETLDMILGTDSGFDRKKTFLAESGELLTTLQLAREKIAEMRLGPVTITLGRSDGIAKFFAFSFVSEEKRPLSEVVSRGFNGSGIYAIYYHGSGESAYATISGSETPIYVGKADPKNPFAVSLEDQGQAIAKRLKEHAKSIGNTNLSLDDFWYRAAPIQTGMQAAVEAFMIGLFRPIWNKEIKVCFGIGKHGDSALTRANKRSPWDTMHPGRAWATATKEDQRDRDEIERKIKAHFAQHPPIPDREALLEHLALR